jgi:hypothetical protein
MQGNELQALPDNGTCCGLVTSLSVINRFALNRPKVVGANVTEMPHEPPEATLVVIFPWQGAVTENWMESVVCPVMFSAEPPAFMSVSGNFFVGCGEREFFFSPPKSSLAGISLTVPDVRVIWAVADLVGSSIDVAVMVTLGFAGTEAGAAYMAGVPLAVFAVIVPHASVHAIVPCVSVQLTPWLVESLLTVPFTGVIFNCGSPLVGMNALEPETEQLVSVQILAVTVMAGTVIWIGPCWLKSESEVATILTDTSLAGGFLGAL